MPAQKRRALTWVALRRIVIGLAWTATVIALFYGIENWRCRRVWAQYLSAAEARGEHLDFSDFIPKPIRDDQNFFMADSLPETIFNAAPGKEYVFKDNYSWAEKHIDPPDTNRAGTEFHLIDLSAWEKALAAATALGTGASAPGAQARGPWIYRVTDPDPTSRGAAAPGVLRGLQDIAPILDALQAASSRPEARFPADYDTENPSTIRLPQLSELRHATDRLRLRACAELALGRTDDALKDLKLMFYLSDAVRNEPFLVSGIDPIIMLPEQVQVIREGLAAHRWSDAQLQDIQEWLLACDWVSGLQHALAGERASAIAVSEYYRLKKNFAAMLIAFAAPAGLPTPEVGLPGLILAAIMPQGWVHLEQINATDYSRALFQGAIDPAAKRIFPRRLEANIALSERTVPTGDLDAIMHHRFMVWEWIAMTNTSLVRLFASAQCVNDEAAIACGLERYRLAKGNYPTGVDGLAPAYIPALPNDALTGQPYRYRRDRADTYALYSVGWNLKDDDGTPGKGPYSEDGDWVW